MGNRFCFFVFLLTVTLLVYSPVPISSLSYLDADNIVRASSCMCSEFDNDDGDGYVCTFRFNNIQNVPNDTSHGRNLFQAFYADDEKCLERDDDGMNWLVPWVEETIRKCNSTSINRAARSMLESITPIERGFTINITFCELGESNERYYTLKTRNLNARTCPTNERLFCQNVDTSTDGYQLFTSDFTASYLDPNQYSTTFNWNGLRNPTVTPTIPSGRLKEVLTAIGIGIGSIIVFIIAVILVVVCCRRMSYKLNQDKIEHVENGDISDNPVYGGQDEKPINIPVYAKPDKRNKNDIPANESTSRVVDDSGYEDATIFNTPASGYEEATTFNTPASGYEEATTFNTPASGYEEATLPPISNDNHGYVEAYGTPKRPIPASTSTPSGYETANDISDAHGDVDDFRTPRAAVDASGYEDNFVTPGGNDGYEDNFVTPPTSTKESMKYDHINRKLDLDGTPINVQHEPSPGYGEVQVQSELVDQEEYQHLDHDKKASDTPAGYGKLEIQPHT